MRILAIVSIFCFTHLCFANNEISMTSKARSSGEAKSQTQRLADVEKQLDQLKQENVYGTVGAKLSDADSCFNNIGLFIEADYLYWKAQNQGVPYLLDSIPQGTYVEPALIFKYKRLDPKYKSGVRGKLGYNLDYDGWSLLATYTYLSSKDQATKSLESEGEQLFDPIILDRDNITDDLVSYLLHKWYFTYHMGTLTMGKSVFLSKAFSIDALLGVQGGYIKQRIHHEYTTAASAGEIEYGIVKAHGTYWGMGPKIEIDGKWHFAKTGLFLFLNGNTALLYGENSSEKKQYVQKPTDADYIYRIKKTDSYMQIVPHLQYTIGLGWGICAYEKAYINLNAGWETNYYFNLNSCRNILNVRYYTNSPVMMNGLTAGLKIDF